MPWENHCDSITDWFPVWIVRLPWIDYCIGALCYSLKPPTVAHNCHGKTKSHGTTNLTHFKTMLFDGKKKLTHGRTPLIHGKTK